MVDIKTRGRIRKPDGSRVRCNVCGEMKYTVYQVIKPTPMGVCADCINIVRGGENGGA